MGLSMCLGLLTWPSVSIRVVVAKWNIQPEVSFKPILSLACTC